MNSDHRLQRGILLFEQENFAGAVNELRQHLFQEPEDPVAHAVLALSLSRIKQYDEATQAAQTAITCGPDLGLTHYALASVMEDRNRFDEAIAAINIALEIDPQDTTYLALLGSLMFSKRRWADALEVANRGLSIDPDDAGCGNVRAAALVQLGRHEEAESTIDGMLQSQPNNSTSHANLGWSLLHQGQRREAAEHFREALRLDPNSEWARQGMLECLKARNIVYRLLLRFFLFMSKLSSQGQWIVILGLWFAFQLVRRLGKALPDWEPYLQPLLYAYLGFAALTWIGVPLFNLFLRLDSFGRYMLSDDERQDSTVFGGAVLVTLIFAGLAIALGGFWIYAVFVSGMMLLPISAFLRCNRGWPRLAMALYMIGLLVVAAGALFNESWIYIFFLGSILSSIVGNLLASATPTK